MWRWKDAVPVCVCVCAVLFSMRSWCALLPLLKPWEARGEACGIVLTWLVEGDGAEPGGEYFCFLYNSRWQQGWAAEYMNVVSASDIII